MNAKAPPQLVGSNGGSVSSVFGNDRSLELRGSGVPSAVLTCSA
jgi:hypothetical protein